MSNARDSDSKGVAGGCPIRGRSPFEIDIDAFEAAQRHLLGQTLKKIILEWLCWPSCSVSIGNIPLHIPAALNIRIINSAAVYTKALTICTIN